MSLHTEVGIKPIGPPPQHETDLLDLTYNILPVALPTGLQHSLKFLTKTRFKLYLQANVTNSHWSEYPPRRYYRKPRIYDSSSQRSKDIGLFRIRSGHNKLSHHLYNMRMKDTNKCRFCNEEIEDCYHLLIECAETIHRNQIKELRTRMNIASRASFNSWL